MALEKKVSFNSGVHRIAGTACYAKLPNRSTFLLLHGFAGTRNEVAIPSLGIGIFEHVAARLADLGHSSLRIDFRGWGDSDGSIQETSYSTQIDDCLAAMDFIATQPDLNNGEVILLGWSQGGLVAAAAAGRTNRPSGVALWASVGEPKVSFPRLVGQDAYSKGLNSEEPTTLTLPWGASVTLGHSFFAEVSRFDPIAELSNYSGAAFIAEGTLDDAIPQGTARKFAEAHRGEHSVWESAMDHAFNTASGVETLNTLTHATVDYFRSRPKS
ncbi:alpha/beta hydrolase [Agrobacterium tumefaciens]|uniref:alpha/beta hydrolase n=1 Tax=Agrobacterium tumefaciens TaxID=358 RepID=UPI001573DE2E|nr:alpha/beta fold hydrolase [Agrobacterium tumefaciens]NTA19035.1 alpha/beta hydrolase [Agrobacterium tumefaciens]WCK74406.1 alpha/beta fold hydrolase [Agrobacterium tumefaciens]